MNTSPPLTIGIPAYNAEATISQTLDSVLAQDFPDFHVIVSDNCSTDATAQILASYARQDRRVKVVRQESNIGGAANFSALPGLATTPYFKWQSADDLMSRDYVGACFATITAHPDTVLAYGDTVMIDGDGDYLRKHDDNLHLVHDTPAQRVTAFVKQQWLCNVQFGVARRDVLTSTSLIQKYPASDVAMLGQLAALGKFRHVEGVTFYRRFTDDSMGLGSLDKAQKAAWLGTKDVTNNPQWRVYQDTRKGIWRSSLSLPEKLAALAAYDKVRARRAVGRWRYNRKLASGKATRVTWDDLFAEAKEGSTLRIGGGPTILDPMTGSHPSISGL